MTATSDKPPGTLEMPKMAKRIPPRPKQRRSFRWTLAAVAGLTVLFALASAYFPEQVGLIWYARFVDVVVVGTLLLAAAVGLQIARPDKKATDFAKSPEFAITTSLVLLGTLFVTYASFRNQTRLAAEVGLNVEAMEVYQLELAHPELRCLYDNYGHANYEACLTRIVADPAIWSRAIFYVEEAWFILDIARVDERQWGSTYSDSIEFWREDVGKDPTGLFSYYLVATAEGGQFSNAVAAMTSAGVEIQFLCANYLKVWRALQKQGANPRERIRCSPER